MASFIASLLGRPIDTSQAPAQTGGSGTSSYFGRTYTKVTSLFFTTTSNTNAPGSAASASENQPAAASPGLLKRTCKKLLSWSWSIISTMAASVLLIVSQAILTGWFFANGTKLVEKVLVAGVKLSIANSVSPAMLDNVAQVTALALLPQAMPIASGFVAAVVPLIVIKVCSSVYGYFYPKT